MTKFVGNFMSALNKLITYQESQGTGEFLAKVNINLHNISVTIDHLIINVHTDYISIPAKETFRAKNLN